MTSDMEARIADLEARLSQRSARERLLTVALAMSAAAFIGGAAASDAPDQLTLKRLTIVDDAGTPRMIIGSHLPDPPMLGRRAGRGMTGHGILLVDQNGTERGSFITIDESDSAMMSLDNVGRMVVQMAAGPVGGARLMMRDDDGSDIRMGAYAGGPYVRLAKGETERSLTVEGLSDAR